MIDAAAKRNATYVEAGLATLVLASLEEWRTHERFDKVFGVHFPPYRRDREGTLALVRPLLAPGGTARFFEGAPASL
jgi:hypothetical protein